MHIDGQAASVGDEAEVQLQRGRMTAGLAELICAVGLSVCLPPSLCADGDGCEASMRMETGERMDGVEAAYRGQSAVELTAAEGDDGRCSWAERIGLRSDSLCTHLSAFLFSSRYYENSTHSVATRRWVIYPHSPSKESDPADVVPEWHMWLHQQVEETPDEVRRGGGGNKALQRATRSCVSVIRSRVSSSTLTATARYIRLIYSMPFGCLARSDVASFSPPVDAAAAQGIASQSNGL